MSIGDDEAVKGEHTSEWLLLYHPRPHQTWLNQVADTYLANLEKRPSSWDTMLQVPVLAIFASGSCFLSGVFRD